MQQSAATAADINNLRIVNNTILFELNKPNAYTNSKVTFSAKLNSSSIVTHNEISVRWSIGPHTGQEIVKCFDVGFGIKTGKTRFRYELKHPEYTDVIANGDVIGYPLNTDEYVGLEFVKQNLPDEHATLLEVYQSTHVERMKLFSHKTSEYFVDDYQNGCQIAIKPKENFDKIDIKDISITEIQ